MNAVLQQWLLNLAVDFPVTLNLLARIVDGDDSEANALNVRSLTGFSLEHAIARLVELAEAGLIEFEYQSEEGDSRIVAPSALRPMMIAHAAAEQKLSFKLTSTGA